MNKGIRGTVMKRSITILLLLFISAVMISACKNKTSSGNTTPLVSGGTGSGIGPAGGAVVGLYGAQLSIPAGALSSTVTITVTRDSTSAPAFPLPGVDAVGATYEITPHGTPFALPATISIPFDPAQLPADAVVKMYKAEQGGTFAEIPATINNNMIEASISNLSWVIPAYASTRPRSVYVNTAAGITSYRINSTTGALSGPTGTASAGPSPTTIVAHPSGRFAYVTYGPGASVNGIDPYSVAAYRLNAVSGAISGPTYTAPSTTASVQARPTAAVIHPMGNFLYVVNYGPSGGNADVSLFSINPTTGALIGPVSTGDSGGAPTTGMAIHPTGKFAYVVYAWSPSTPMGNGYMNTVSVFPINQTTGVLSSPTSSVGISDTPWSIVIDPSGQYAYVGSIHNSSNFDQVSVYRINATTGALTYQGGTTVSSNPASLSMDTRGRFLYVGKQSPYYNINLEVYAINGSTGLLTSSGSVLTGTGSMVGPISVVAEPQGNFVYVLDINSELVAYKVSTSGTLSSSGAVTGVFLPGNGSSNGVPFSFAVTGTSPIWQNSCTVGCYIVLGSTGSGGGGGGGGGNVVGPGNGMHYLEVRNDPIWGGWIWSTPSGIDFGHDWIAAPPNVFSAEFANGTSVQLCQQPNPNLYMAFDVQWTGGCSGTGTCTTVQMDRDQTCHLTLIKR
jgi:DNA-binding beta-propeller fold protein YncE